jgi:hypothetical protein
MGHLKAGMLLTADVLNDLLGVTVSDSQSASATTSSTSYTETLTGGTPAGVAFVAPTSGKVIIHNSSFVKSSSATSGRRTLLSWILRTGAVVGSGTTVLAANDTWALVSSRSVKDSAFGRSTLITGLTPGNSYNIRQAMKVINGADTGTSQYRHILVKPTV